MLAEAAATDPAINVVSTRGVRTTYKVKPAKLVVVGVVARTKAVMLTILLIIVLSELRTMMLARFRVQVKVPTRVIAVVPSPQYPLAVTFRRIAGPPIAISLAVIMKKGPASTVISASFAPR